MTPSLWDAPSGFLARSDACTLAGPGGSRLSYGLLPRSPAGLSPALLFRIQALLASSLGR